MFYLLIISALIALAVLLKEKVFVLFWVGQVVSRKWAQSFWKLTWPNHKQHATWVQLQELSLSYLLFSQKFFILLVTILLGNFYPLAY